MELSELARTILFGESMEDKLITPQNLTDRNPGTHINMPNRPGRPPELAFGRKQKHAFPGPAELATDVGRAAVLHFFANHELLAMELMALALIKFPDAPSSFRMGLAQTIAEEQAHMLLYRKRMRELGMDFGDIAVNEFFWNCLKDMKSPMDYVTGMSMTFEQANLDYSLYYLGLFRQHGDEKSADIMDQVYQDEIGHVKYGVSWFEKLRPAGISQWEAHRRAMFARKPLTIARAKGNTYDRAGRLLAGFDLEYVDRMEIFENPKGRDPVLYWYNADCELEHSYPPWAYSPSKGVSLLMSDFEALLMFCAQNGDAVLCRRPPTQEFLRDLKEKTQKLPEFVEWNGKPDTLDSIMDHRSYRDFKPWGWTPRIKDVAQRLREKSNCADLQIPWTDKLALLYDKTKFPDLRSQLRKESKRLNQLMGPCETDGRVLGHETDISDYIEHIHRAFLLPAVIKSPFGFSGSGQCRVYPGRKLNDSQIGWLKKQLDEHGHVVVEPWLPCAMDGSAVWESSTNKPKMTFFLTDSKGRYMGHRLGSRSSKIPKKWLRFLLEEQDDCPSRLDLISLAAEKVRHYLGDLGYFGPAGMDYYIYRWPVDGQYYIRVLGEVNSRRTMGHIATAIESSIKRSYPSLWLALTLNDVKRMGYCSIKDFCQTIKQYAKSEHDLVFTNDPEQALGAISFLISNVDSVAKFRSQFSNENLVRE